MPELTLGQKQRIFAGLVGRLLVKIYESGYSCSLGEATRSDEQAVINSYGEDKRGQLAQDLASKYPALSLAIANNGGGNGILLSLHRDKLAIDLNLFNGLSYLPSTEDHKPFGEWWEQQHELCRWGGRFNDGNHYSMEHQGRK